MIFFVCTDYTEIFSKLKSAGLNYNLTSFFSLTLTVRGVSNKHCLLTFFIFHAFLSWCRLLIFFFQNLFFRKILSEIPSCRAFVCLFGCFTSQINSYGHGRTVSSPNHTFSWASLNKRLTSNSCTYFRL